MEKPTADSLNRWLPHFVVEVRRKDENRTRPVAFLTNWLVFIATAKNATVTARIS